MLQNRRQFLGTLLRLGLAIGAGSSLSFPASATDPKTGPLKKAIPSTGELLPVIGLGTSRSFEIENDPQAIDNLQKVLQAFYEHAGAVIDSSPMYGSAEAVLGKLFARIANPSDRFIATKVWIEGQQAGIDQMHESMQKMGIRRVDLMQVHNLVDWKTQLDTLNRWKAEGKIRYVGITTSHGKLHDEFVEIMQSKPLDFVQLTYNIGEREAEKVLLPLAMDRSIAVLANRPFQQGDLFRKTRNKPLPKWANDCGCTTWAQFFLKYTSSHPAITCAIPATANLAHMRDNMSANFGVLADAHMRKEMEGYFGRL